MHLKSPKKTPGRGVARLLAARSDRAASSLVLAVAVTDGSSKPNRDQRKMLSESRRATDGFLGPSARANTPKNNYGAAVA